MTSGHPQHFVNSNVAEEVVLIASMPAISPQLATGSPMSYGLMHEVKGHLTNLHHVVFSLSLSRPPFTSKKMRAG